MQDTPFHKLDVLFNNGTTKHFIVIANPRKVQNDVAHKLMQFAYAMFDCVAPLRTKDGSIPRDPDDRGVFRMASYVNGADVSSFDLIPLTVEETLTAFELVSDTHHEQLFGLL